MLAAGGVTSFQALPAQQQADLARASTKRPSWRFRQVRRRPEADRAQAPGGGGWRGREPPIARAAQCRMCRSGACGAATELHLCTDNGAMVAVAAAMRLQSGLRLAVSGNASTSEPAGPCARCKRCCRRTVHMVRGQLLIDSGLRSRAAECAYWMLSSAEVYAGTFLASLQGQHAVFRLGFGSGRCPLPGETLVGGAVAAGCIVFALDADHGTSRWRCARCSLAMPRNIQALKLT